MKEKIILAVATVLLISGSVVFYYNNVDNEGHIWVCLKNEGDKDYIIKVGDSFAQGIFTKFLITDNDRTSGVRVGGLGSTNRSDNNG